MIYLDSSVALARLLVTYEVWNRVHARGVEGTHGEAARILIDRVHLVELSPAVLGRALDAFPAPVRTLDALHLATIEFLRVNGQTVELASYDRRLNAAARALGVPFLAI